MIKPIDDFPDRELIIAQAKKNEPGFCLGAFRRNGIAFYHWYENGELHVVTRCRSSRGGGDTARYDGCAPSPGNEES